MVDKIHDIIGNITLWSLVGFLGMLFFSSRFIVQWIVSEVKKESTIPTIFWYLSIAGSLLQLAYALHIEDPVFTLSLAFNSLIYLRNLQLIYTKRNTLPDPE